MLRLNKYITIIALIGFIAASCGKNKPTDDGKIHFTSAAEYNDYVASSYNAVMSCWNRTLEHMDDSLVAYQYLDTLYNLSEEGELKMQKLGDFEGDTLFRHHSGIFFSYMKELARHEMKESVDIAVQNEISDSLNARFVQLGHIIGDEKQKLVNNVQKSQADFAARQQGNNK